MPQTILVQAKDFVRSKEKPSTVPLSGIAFCATPFTVAVVPQETAFF
jgi:hypothetical protein